MRNGTKSTLYNSFVPLPDNAIHGGNRLEIIDSGWLLHKMVWDHGSTVENICQKYVSFVQRHFNKNVVIVFDGYPENAADWGTKTSERLRRATKLRSTDIIFNETTIPSTTQEKFLANNKTTFIKLLTVHFRKHGITIEQAIEDADTVIVNTALQQASSYDTVIIIGEDIDLLVILTRLNQANANNVFLKKPARGRTYILGTKPKARYIDFQ